MQVDLHDKIAIVTGAAQGIGQAIAEQLVANGAQVAIFDIDVEKARDTAAQLSAAGGKCLVLRADVSSPAEVAEAVAAVTRQLGGLDILVNNAGINLASGREPIHRYADADWSRILRVDLDGVFYTSKLVIPHLIARGGGRIVNIASVLGLVPARLQSAFVAAKAAVINLTKSMSLELAPHKILVNAIAPGSTLTPVTERFIYGPDGAYAEKAQSLLSHIPLGRPGLPHEIASAALFLVAPEASYITGSTLTVDGGWTAGYIRDW
ncbi:MAG TPA: SDR family NAD(P)-dependent oxidoreductase [Gemmataceae bacterium]|jgi:NAD(P)-dependent dehydrogenase (short-subunit alcohol dehydrogenase family)|nr:SDR family NAD(P)-dependent oxidoreductase [Gemmataceae bacterium]